jgi:hypothetical protein
MENGIKPEDYILEWSTYALDLPKLRRMLFDSGFQIYFHPTHIDYPFFRFFGPNIPKAIPLALEFIFAMLIQAMGSNTSTPWSC